MATPYCLYHPTQRELRDLLEIYLPQITTFVNRDDQQAPSHA
jgi:hypothetical protein